MENEMFCVCVDSGGAWEVECVYSIWDTKEHAEEEAIRLNNLDNISLGCNGGIAYVVSTIKNKSNNEWIA